VIAAQKFFVTGLPRSRTCWLANFLTGDDSICLHAGLLSVGADLGRLAERLDSFGKSFVGDADPSLLTFPVFEHSVKLFPGAKWVFVVRNAVEAHTAHAKAFPQLALPLAVVEELSSRIQPAADETAGMVVAFEDLVKEETCDRIHQFCLGRPMDLERWRILTKMRIEADKQAWIRSMSPETKSKVEAVTGEALVS
jgi:hypothetical protein